jgi:hypothetical protein
LDKRSKLRKIEQDMLEWTGLICLRIGTNGSYCEHGNKPLGSNIVFLDVTHRPFFFCLKHNVSETGFCPFPEIGTALSIGPS